MFIIGMSTVCLYAKGIQMMERIDWMWKKKKKTEGKRKKKPSRPGPVLLRATAQTWSRQLSGWCCGGSVGNSDHFDDSPRNIALLGFEGFWLAGTFPRFEVCYLWSACVCLQSMPMCTSASVGLSALERVPICARMWGGPRLANFSLKGTGAKTASAEGWCHPQLDDCSVT